MLSSVLFSLVKGQDGYEGFGYRVVATSQMPRLDCWIHMGKPHKKFLNDKEYSLGYIVFQDLDDARKFSSMKGKLIYKVRFRKLLSLGKVFDYFGEEELNCVTVRQCFYQELIEKHVDGEIISEHFVKNELGV